MPKKHFSKTRRRKGGVGGEDGDWDIEKGTVIPVVPLTRIPSDPVRKREEIGRRFTGSMPPAEAEAFFNGPTPEETQAKERSLMGMEDRESDPEIRAYTDYSKMPLFSEEEEEQEEQEEQEEKQERPDELEEELKDIIKDKC
jgi:hypothetical protein